MHDGCEVFHGFIYNSAGSECKEHFRRPRFNSGYRLVDARIGSVVQAATFDCVQRNYGKNGLKFGILFVNPTNDIHDIKGFVPVPYPWWVWALLAVIIVAIAIIVWAIRRKKPAVAAAPATPPPTPYEVALAALQQLRSENPTVEVFYTRLSDIVRRYLEDQLQLRAPERTTEEFLYELQQGSRLASEHKELLGAFLQEADLVKFARHRPGKEDIERAASAAEKFVRESA